RLKYASPEKVTLANAFEIADDVLIKAVSSISGLIKSTGFINLDFADVTAIMKNAGMAHMGVGRAAGKGKAEEAARMAVSSPLMETSIDGAHGVLINITGSMEMGLEDVEAAATLVQEAANPDANIIFGASFDDSLEDEIVVTVIATGFEDKSEKKPAAHKTSAAARMVFEEEEDLDTTLFSDAVEKAAAAPEASAPASDSEDPFDTIFKIFNNK
ncbi:MAG: cell division protein FtsZ, partial [Ruminococcaceae bacterium]|nr:cell division protein FtsZ [Oscillospiraceae bacterium]